ncbi:MAG: c-type cytochrome [Tahibacter sp.]
MSVFKVVAGLALLAALGMMGFVVSGLYPIGADVPHNALSFWVLQTLRERSIARASADVTVPPLDNPDMLLAGGADYNDMCAGCHLKPGTSRSDLSLGLYPPPPNLSLPLAAATTLPKDVAQASAARQFWIIKHGIKASAMPAWGATHDDARIWNMVAFLQRLPSLTPDQYQILTARTVDDAAPGSVSTTASDHGAAVAVPPFDASTTLLEPSAVVDRFQRLLKSGDTQAAVELLDPQVRIFETGYVEQTRDEYAGHHLGADAAFLKNATIAQKSRSGGAVGDLAWVGSESRLTTTEKGKPVDSASTETMILKKSADGWRIVHIHWSSHPNTSAQ